MESNRSEDSPPDSPGGLGSSGFSREAGYRRRLDAYRRAHHDQAALVARLQAKVLQYKQRCVDLENHMLEGDTHRGHQNPAPSASISAPIALPPPSGMHPTPTSSSMTSTALEQAQQHLREAREERIHDLETALRRLDEERKK